MNNKIELDNEKYDDLCDVTSESIKEDVYLKLCLDFNFELMEIKHFTTFNLSNNE